MLLDQEKWKHLIGTPMDYAVGALRSWGLEVRSLAAGEVHAVTADYRPDRITIYYERSSKKITGIGGRG